MPVYKVKHDGFINSLPGNSQWVILLAISNSTINKSRFDVGDIERFTGLPYGASRSQMQRYRRPHPIPLPEGEGNVRSEF